MEHARNIRIKTKGKSGIGNQYYPEAFISLIFCYVVPVAYKQNLFCMQTNLKHQAAVVVKLNCVGI